ncbi:Predicted phosphohydrolase, MPP superfamily [Butyrivibrio sp. ob235]|uniref:metallophosphoesterase n=1 Tax=Butyrivibrio sp. ob235 TaxID=1761780 RepID=UPI0008C454AF|nr:metallophosphoesterase [Butyrivibrio sp. ob235]SEL77943.1 Predicted phosphohydrolase, MPP superfamily [Butyrivibrio sp. ob235]
MSRVLVIPDVHLKPWIFDKADKVTRDSYDDIVILGDLVDDWNRGNDLDVYRETLDRAAEFGKTHDKSLWCYGNHDVSYLWDAMESGYSIQARETVIEGITKLERVLEDRYRFVHKIENTLFSHAGLTETFVLHACGYHIKDIDEIITKINHMKKDQLWRNSSPIWARPQNDFYRMFRDDIFYQVVGHTPVEEPLNLGGVLSLDLFSTYSDGCAYGNQKLYIVDTEGRSYSEAEEQ